METRKILSIIFSVLFLGVFAFVLAWGITNFNKVQDAMSGTQIYDANDLNNAYNDGYSKALENKDEYDELINTYRDNITSLNDTISQLNSEKNGLQNNILDYQNQVNGLNNIKAQNENLIDSLRNQIEDNSSIIQTLNNQNNNLSNQISVLNATISDKETQIEILDNRIANYQTQIAGLQQDGADNLTRIEELNAEISSLIYTKNRLIREKEELQDNVERLTSEVEVLRRQVINLQQATSSYEETVYSLNSQIFSLNSQIRLISNELQQNSDLNFNLNSKIIELQNSIMFYETYIDSLVDDNHAYAIFEYNDSIYTIQIVNKNSVISIVNPISTEYVIFNGWKVEDEFIDLSTYLITENTKFVADVTYKYDVVFKVDNEDYNTQLITKGSIATIPTTPTKSGYQFVGWTLNGVDVVDVSNTIINDDTRFNAKFIQEHLVSFFVDGELISMQSVLNGNFATYPSFNSLFFNGWSLNGVDYVDLSMIRIFSDMTFIAILNDEYLYLDNENIRLDNINFNIHFPDVSRVEFSSFKIVIKGYSDFISGIPLNSLESENLILSINNINDATDSVMFNLSYVNKINIRVTKTIDALVFNIIGGTNLYFFVDVYLVR